MVQTVSLLGMQALWLELCPVYTDRFFVVRISEKSRSEGPIFYRSGSCSSHGPTFYRRKNIKHTSWFLSECHLAHTARFCATMAGEIPLLDYVTPIFYRTEASAQGPIFCRKQLREKNRNDFLSDQKSEHMNRFSLIFCRCLYAGH